MHPCRLEHAAQRCYHEAHQLVASGLPPGHHHPALCLGRHHPTRVADCCGECDFSGSLLFVARLRLCPLRSRRALPIARGVAPLLSTIWSMLLLGDRPNSYGIGAVVLITGGTIWIGLRNRTAGQPLTIPWLPILVALMISGYTIVDAYGTRASSPFVYYSVCMTCTGIAMIPYIWSQTPDLRTAVLREAPRALLIGAGSFASYLMVLSCYRVAPVSYVAAAREMSIIIAGIIGWLWLKEPFGGARLVGTASVATGVILLVLFG